MSSVFKIYSPEDCDFYYDGELQGHIEGNSKKAFRFEVERKGVYRLEFINSEYQTELMMKVSIDADEEQEVELDFSEVNEPAIQEREKIITAIEHNYIPGERLPEEIISTISKNGIVTIPKGVRKIGRMAFQDCGSLTSVTIPDHVTEIGDCAFSNCNSLTSINIPNSVTKIGSSSFSECSSLRSAIIPNSITEIGGGAFFGCSSLTSVTIPNSVTDIGVNAFSGCRSLTGITIPDGITEIGDYTFYDCNSLTNVTVPDSVTKIGQDAFVGCISLANVTIPDSVTEIGKDAFYGCSNLTSINIPDRVTNIGYCAFYGCTNLTSFYCKSKTPPNLEDRIFYNNAPDLKIYVPKSGGSTVLEAYKSAENWKDYADIIEEYDFDNE